MDDYERVLGWVREATGWSELTAGRTLQTLWSGYGRLFRVHGPAGQSAIIKWVSPPDGRMHPRGFGGARSHARKLRSYEVERHFYEHWSGQTNTECRVPRCLGARQWTNGAAFILEDLDSAGFPERLSDLSPRALDASLCWLAGFHARFLGERPDGLWPTGTYWHLETRPDELERTTDRRLKAAAASLDAALSSAQFQTWVHGDAKAQNLCFSRDHASVAAVDFQYVGGGCAMKDVAYFFSSCLSERDLERQDSDLLDQYFAHLSSTLRARDLDPRPVEAEWRALYPVAWADFARFLSGWAPDHWKLHRYTRAMVDRALEMVR